MGTSGYSTCYMLRQSCNGILGGACALPEPHVDTSPRLPALQYSDMGGAPPVDLQPQSRMAGAHMAWKAESVESQIL